jgi:aryl-alcohol dehydrogenase-like predicted oxidoreductase
MTDIFVPVPESKTELGRYWILSSTAGVRVSPLCLGAMSPGTGWESFMGAVDQEKSFELLDAFQEAGGNFIDTANLYQNEESEKFIGEWMQCFPHDWLQKAREFNVKYRGT